MEIFESSDDFPIILYHATSSNNILPLKSGIIIEKGKRKVDFGQGFYLTGNFEQAKSWAGRKGKVAAQIEGNSSIKGAVVAHELDAEVIKREKMNVKIFRREDKRWASFVLKNRTGDPLTTGEPIDIIYGPMADGNTSVLVRKVQDRRITFAHFQRSLRGTKYPFPIDHQFSFHTKKSLRSLRLIDVLEVDNNG